MGNDLSQVRCEEVCSAVLGEASYVSSWLSRAKELKWIFFC